MEADAVSPRGPIQDVTARDPLCLVLMPFGRKTDATGLSIDFDAVYDDLIAPAVHAADLEPIRADEEITGNVSTKPMFERLIFCRYALADVSIANANVFYELGVRHAVRSSSTVLLFAAGTRAPFDVELGHGVPYRLTSTGAPTGLDAARKQLTDRLIAARDTSVDSPLFQLIEGYPKLDQHKADVFRDQVHYSEMWKERLQHARRKGREAVHAAERELGDLHNVPTGILVDLFLSYRAVMGYEEMVALTERMPWPLVKTPLVREQLALALNRLGRRDEAERVLLALIEERGPNSETYGILGRVYKDRWTDAVAAGDDLLAERLLEKAVQAYLAGFEADWRDAYPGINVVMLMEIHNPPDPRREHLLPVVSYAVERRLASGRADYWDHATRLELAVLAEDEPGARRALGRSLAMVRWSWEPESTAADLRLIREARQRRGDDVPWAESVERELLQRAGGDTAGQHLNHSRG